MVSERTISRWLKQEADEGHVKPKTGYQKGHSHIIKDPQELITLLDLLRKLSVFNILCKSE